MWRTHCELFFGKNRSKDISIKVILFLNDQKSFVL